MVYIIETFRALIEMKKTDKVIKEIIEKNGLSYFIKHKEKILRKASA